MKRICTLFIAVFILATMSTIASAADFPANPVTKEGYTLDFQEEFDEPELNRDKWTDYYLPHWCEDVSKAKGNYRIEDGCLIEYITEDQVAWCPEHDGTVKSSAIMSFDKSWIHNFSGTTDNHDRETWYGYTTTYGYFEMRAKLADCGGGGHQAWWLVGMQEDTDNWFDSRQNGEIDIIETLFSRTDTWRIAAYGWADPSFQTSWYCSDEAVPYGSPTEEFHIYAVDWSPGSLKFYYDNELYRTIYSSPSYDMGMIVNIYTDAGSGTHNDVWPKEWAIDYIRVWKSDDGYDVQSDVYSIKNRQTDEYMYIDPDSDSVKYGPITSSNAEYALWETIPVEGYNIIMNHKTGDYLHIEDLQGYVQHDVLPLDYWSAHWTFVDVDGYTRFVNRWQEDVAMHTEDYTGDVQYGTCPMTWWTSQWMLTPVG